MQQPTSSCTGRRPRWAWTDRECGACHGALPKAEGRGTYKGPMGGAYCSARCVCKGATCATCRQAFAADTVPHVSDMLRQTWTHQGRCAEGKPPLKPPRNGRSVRTKGHNFERSLVHRFREVFGDQVERGLGQARAGGTVPDVANAGSLWLEAKRGIRTNPRAALRQAREALARLDGRTAYKIPVAVCKDDNEPEFVVLGLDDFLMLLKTGYGT